MVFGAGFFIFNLKLVKLKMANENVSNKCSTNLDTGVPTAGFVNLSG